MPSSPAAARALAVAVSALERVSAPHAAHAHHHIPLIRPGVQNLSRRSAEPVTRLDALQRELQRVESHAARQMGETTRSIDANVHLEGRAGAHCRRPPQGRVQPDAGSRCGSQREPGQERRSLNHERSRWPESRGTTP